MARPTIDPRLLEGPDVESEFELRGGHLAALRRARARGLGVTHADPGTPALASEEGPSVERQWAMNPRGLRKLRDARKRGGSR